MKSGRLKLFLLYLIAVIVAFSVVLPFKANAVSSSSILVTVTPENPAPNENVSITLNSYASDLDSVLISWSVDGKTALSGIGKKSFSLTAPNAGGELNVIATVALPDGTIDTRVIIRPAEMVLLWQANDSYTPPFYRGKALPAPESSVKVVAMPEIKISSGIISPTNLTYSWKQDYTNNTDGSGYGKNYFVYTNDYLNSSNNINVTASTTDQQYSSEANIDIGTYQPKIEFYKRDGNLGTLWEQALFDGHKIVGDEVMVAEPYFISPADIRIPFLTFTWSINDEQIAVENYNKTLMPLQVQAGASGTSKIKLEIENTYKIFADISRTINVVF